jgi:hypothetical protein
MAQPRIGTLKPEDRQAVFNSAKRLGLNPYEFGALIHQESGFRPNVFGGAGGNYYGLIQFGGPERNKYLDKNKIGKYTIAEQLPAVEQFLTDRGFKPGQMGIDRAYATILGGNPNVSLTAKDSFGTSVSSSIPRFKPGGQLYKAAQQTLGDVLNATPPPAPAPQPSSSVESILGRALKGEQKPGLAIKEFITNSILAETLKQNQPSIGLFNPVLPSVGLPTLPSFLNPFSNQ